MLRLQRLLCCVRFSHRGDRIIGVEDFDRVEMRAGTVVDVQVNKKARNPAYAVKIDFDEFGVKTSSAQITGLYSPEDLIGRQVICCTNLSPMHIGSVKSEVRILGTDSEQGVVLLQPAQKVKDGDRVFRGLVTLDSAHQRAASSAGNAWQVAGVCWSLLLLSYRRGHSEGLMQLLRRNSSHRFRVRASFGWTTPLSASLSSGTAVMELPQNWQIEKGFRPESRPHNGHFIKRRRQKGI